MTPSTLLSFEEWMTKRIDFAKQRKAEGRSLATAARDFTASLLATQEGINFKKNLDERLARQREERQQLAKRLQEFVVPLFIRGQSGPPDRIGSCVLVCLDSGFYAFTAAHVIRQIGSAMLLAPSGGNGGKLEPLPQCSAHLNSSRGHDLDVGVLVFSAGQLGPFRGRDFLAGQEIDQKDRPDDLSIRSFYFVLGYSASRTQVKVSRAERRIFQQSFHCSTQPVDAAEYQQERLSRTDYVLLDFDHKEMKVEGRPVTAPKLNGVSGGGIFQISRETGCGPLVAIATENRRSSRLIVGTRIKHFIAMVRGL